MYLGGVLGGGDACGFQGDRFSVQPVFAVFHIMQLVIKGFECCTFDWRCERFQKDCSFNVLHLQKCRKLFFF